MYRIELGQLKETPSFLIGFAKRERDFAEQISQITGQLVVPYLSDYNPTRVDIRFDEDAIPNTSEPADSYSEAVRTISDDDLATGAVSRALDRHFAKSHDELQTELGR